MLLTAVAVGDTTEGLKMFISHPDFVIPVDLLTSSFPLT